MTVKATSDETNGVFSLLEAEEPPGFGPPLHIHHDAAEAFYVVEGEYVMFLDDREVACPAGSFVFIRQACGTASGSARHRVGSSTSTFRRRCSVTSTNSATPSGALKSTRACSPRSRVGI